MKSIFAILTLAITISFHNTQTTANSRLTSLARTTLHKYPFLRANIQQQPFLHPYSPWTHIRQSALSIKPTYPWRSFSTTGPTHGYLDQIRMKFTRAPKTASDYLVQHAAEIMTVPSVESILAKMDEVHPHHFIISRNTQNDVKAILNNPSQAEHFINDLAVTRRLKEEELEEIKTDIWYAGTLKQKELEDYVQRLQALDTFVQQNRVRHEVW